MSAYLIAHIKVTDPTQYKEYTKLSPDAIARYGGRYIVRGGDVVTLEGPEEDRRIVVVEFASVAQAQTFYQSPEYQAAKAVREGAAEGQFIVVDGVAPGD